jgi:DNA/RNA endonuclease G (NUC1)
MSRLSFSLKEILTLVLLISLGAHGFVLNASYHSSHKNRFRNESIHASCGTAQSGRYYFPIPSQSPKGQINLMYAQYDSNRGLPISTTTYHDSMNHIQSVPRVDNFREWDCPQLPVPNVQSDCSKTYKMTAAQQAKSGYTAFDRGHMVPVNPYRFHEEAVSNTFYCVNIAPQEPYTNQNPWFTVEDKVHRRTTAGFVITGLCQSNSADGVTEDGVQVPSCFWKLLCYKSGTKTHVVGFIGENALFARSNLVLQEERRINTIKARSQQAVMNRNGGESEIVKAWTTASQHLLGNREASLAPNPTDCANQRNLDSAVEEEWSRVMLEVD